MSYQIDYSKKHPLQHYGSIIPKLHVEEIETLSYLSDRCTKYQADLNIFKGDLTRFVLFKTSKEEHDNRLFIAIHHLVVDGVSLRILTEDFMSLIENYLIGNKTTLPTKRTSYRQWNKKIKSYVATNSLKNEYLYWKKILANYAPLPVDMNYDSSITYQETKNIRVSLSSSLTHTLVHDINNIYGTGINDILISALTIALSDWITMPKVVIGLEGHGREELFKDLDINRTVGWFTSMYPICLNVEGVENIDNLIADTKDMLRGVPNKGIGYGALRFESDSLNIKSNLSMFYEDLVFNYLGSFDNNFSTEQERIGSISLEDSGCTIGRKNVNHHKIIIDCIIVDGHLYVNLNYDGKRYNDSTIQKFADAYISAVENILFHSHELGESEESLSESEDFEIFSL
jgi:non-ribosomal peptide synthase protein (TIGR01720 family)